MCGCGILWFPLTTLPCLLALSLLSGCLGSHVGVILQVCLLTLLDDSLRANSLTPWLWHSFCPSSAIYFDRFFLGRMKTNIFLCLLLLSNSFNNTEIPVCMKFTIGLQRKHKPWKSYLSTFIKLVLHINSFLMWIHLFRDMALVYCRGKWMIICNTIFQS